MMKLPSSRICLAVLLALGLWSSSGLPGLLAQEEEEVLPLPQWSPEDRQLMQLNPGPPIPLGGLLWPTEESLAPETVRPAVPAASGPGNELRPTAPPEIADRPGTAQPKADLSHFMPPELLSSRQPPAPAPVVPVTQKNLSASFLAAASRAPATEFLLDPDGNLGETHSADIRHFLESHASDSRIDAYILLTAGHERLPPGTNLASTASGVLLREEGCLVVYPYGQPQRARLFLSRSVHGNVPAPYLASVLEDCVSDATEATDADDQLHRFLVRLSIRLFWLERMLPPKSPALAAKTAAESPKAGAAALAEIGTKPAEDSPAPSLLAIRIDHRIWKGSALAASLGLVFFGIVRWQRYRLRHYVWVLPEAQTLDPRLGGAHCGGSAAWIRYR